MLLGATELVGTCYVQQTREAKACSLMSTSLGPPGLAFLLPVTGTCVFSASLSLPSPHLSAGGQKVCSRVHLSCLPTWLTLSYPLLSPPPPDCVLWGWGWGGWLRLVMLVVDTPARQPTLVCCSPSACESVACPRPGSLVGALWLDLGRWPWPLPELKRHLV